MCDDCCETGEAEKERGFCVRLMAIRAGSRSVVGGRRRLRLLRLRLAKLGK